MLVAEQPNEVFPSRARAQRDAGPGDFVGVRRVLRRLRRSAPFPLRAVLVVGDEAHREHRDSRDDVERGQTTVTVDVTNTGSRRGDEVVQLYIRDEVSSVTRPVKELRGFRRVALDPGQTKTVEFSLGPNELSFLNRDMHRVVEPGSFKIMVGGNSVDLIDAKLNVLEK